MPKQKNKTTFPAYQNLQSNKFEENFCVPGEAEQFFGLFFLQNGFLAGKEGEKKKIRKERNGRE